MSDGPLPPPDGPAPHGPPAPPPAGSPPAAGRPPPWPPSRVPRAPLPPPVPTPAARLPWARAAVLSEHPRDLAALAALLAAGLVTLGAIVVALLWTSDFGVPLAERLRVSTATLVVAVPVLLATALLLAGRDRAGRAGPTAGLVATGVVVVACPAGVLLAGRLLADLVAGGDDLAAAPVGGVVGRLGAVLVDLGALALTAALAWWALRQVRDAGDVRDAGGR